MASLSSQPSKKSLRSSGGSNNSQGTRNSSGQTVKFARRTSSGRYVSLSREDLDMSGELSGDYMNYTVHIPPTPDNQPMDSSVAVKAEEQYVSNSLFTGGFNSVTRAHLMDKVIDSEVTHPQMAGAKGSSCAMPACDGKVMKDERGADALDVAGSKFVETATWMHKKNQVSVQVVRSHTKWEIMMTDAGDFSSGALPLPAPNGSKRDPNNMSVMKRNQTGEFDHNRWLFETKGTYGVGNAYWPQDDIYGDDGDEGLQGGMLESQDKPWKPLSRKLPIPAGIISPYRLLIAVRFVVLCFFLHWRVTHPNEEAVWLWLMSVVCEIWFAFSWILDQVPKLCPINRSTELEVLREKFDMPSPSNPTGRSDLPGVDLFVSTADPEKEPPLVTANTILSILAVDYPVEKLACYISDDGGALLTFEAMAEAASFADLWVPFCRKHDIEPRNPDSYFSLKVDPTKNKSRSDFVKDRRRVKREYDEFKVRVNGLPDSIRRRSDAFNAREEMKMLKHMRENSTDPLEPMKVQKATWMADGSHWPGTWAVPSREHAKGDHAGILQVMLKPPSCDPMMGGENDKLIDFTDVDIRLPMFVYMSREKRQGYDHNKKAGAMNALFPQRFEGIDPSDRYANHNTVFFDGNMRALDGVQGPVYVGTGCMFRRFALYDVNQLPKRFGNSTMLAESIPVAEYQARPLADHPAVKFGRPPGALRVPREPLDAPTVAEAVSVISCWYEDKTEWGDRVGWIYGSVTEDVVTGYRMHNRGWHSVYCITKRDAFRGSAPINLTDRLHQPFLEVKWSGVGLEEWWRNEQFWLISGTSAHLAAVLQGLLKVIAGIEISFTLTSKSSGEDVDDIFADLYIVKWTSLMIPPIVIAMVNIIAIAVAFSRTIYSSVPEWSKFVGGAFFSFWVLAHLYPFAKGLMGRRGKTPTIVFVWSGLIAITLSLLWVAISPPKATDQGQATGGGGGFQFP
ncbi:Cellulose synthase [Quillaja saponaria]|uniref:Cellulose synthase n=1 Tax=Quillaja saponaria TaxID=32244 RepID=A0AAD7VNZ3_QUISA|nr:Cellulose synthase [Quillaja saponaria]